jgi:hypothetical protein
MTYVPVRLCRTKLTGVGNNICWLCEKKTGRLICKYKNTSLSYSQFIDRMRQAYGTLAGMCLEVSKIAESAFPELSWTGGRVILEDGTRVRHNWLRNKETSEIVDFTKEQFAGKLQYVEDDEDIFM